MKGKCKNCGKNYNHSNNSDFCSKQCNKKYTSKFYTSVSGISRESVESALQKQNNVCAICGNEETAFDSTNNKIRRLSADHCHVTGVFRGMLCSRCNSGLGLFRDSTTILENAIKYLEDVSPYLYK